jgi:hypothetical protein
MRGLENHVRKAAFVYAVAWYCHKRQYTNFFPFVDNLLINAWQFIDKLPSAAFWPCSSLYAGRK